MSEQHGGDPQRLKRWQERWEENDVKFHKGVANPTLVSRCTQVALGRKELIFLVPLCGKSLDLLWLYQQGHTVIGIEGVEKAVLDFFRENKLNHEIKTFGPGQVYETADGRLRIYRGDFFEYSKDIIGEVDCVWDRGSLVAVYKEDRSKYVQLMKSFLKPTFRYLLQTVEYNATDARDVTPRSVPCNEVVQLYGDVCNVEVLETVEINKDDISQIDAPVIHMHDLLLTPKS